MSLNDTPCANRTHIAFFGMRNAGKSSLVNAMTGQAVSLVSRLPGTTTDPVAKAMEILPMGPVVLIDTPGIDDVGELGALRVDKALKTLARADIAVLVVDAGAGLREPDQRLLALFRQRNIPCALVWNKADLPAKAAPEGAICVSAQTGEGIRALTEHIGHMASEQAPSGSLLEGLIGAGACVVLVTPIDESAPKGRIILPQQQALRDALDRDALCVVVKETGLRRALETLAAPPALVVTDSQAFGAVAQIVPEQVPLTSFSILMARAKGTLQAALEGIARVETLQDGDRILMAEGCTHHRQCNDIGTVKIPRWLKAHTGKRLTFDTCSGADFPADLTPYALIVHCGGCMLNARTMRTRANMAREQHVAMLNYGILIAHMNGVLARSTAALGI